MTEQAQKGVAWDLDGVIMDSAEAHDLSWVLMARHFGVDYSPERDFKAIFGKHNTDIISSLWGISDPAKLAEMAAYKESAFREESPARSRLLPGVIELMRSLSDAGWKQAIGSSAPRENIDLLLDASGAGHLMEAIASGDDVSRGKPDPEVFLLAFSRIRVEPKYGAVIEDAPAGIKAGLAAGAATIGVTNTQTAQVLHEAGANLVVSSLVDVSVETLEGLLARNKQH